MPITALVMECTALAQRDNRKPIAVDGQAWSSSEHRGLICEGDLSEPIKVRIREGCEPAVGPPGA